MIRFKVLILCTAVVFLLCLGEKNIYSQTTPGYIRIQNVEGELTKRVNVWGYINRPGRYEVPLSTDLIQLITYAGGPKEYAEMDDIQVYRLQENGTRKKIEVDLENPSKVNSSLLYLNDEDTIVIEYSSIVTWRDVIGFVSAPLAMLASIALIVDRLTR